MGTQVSSSLQIAISRELTVLVRPLLLFGGAVQAVSLLTMAGLGSKSHSDTYKTGIIAMLTIFGFGFASGWAPVSHIITAEVPSSRLRDMTYRTASTINILIQ